MLEVVESGLLDTIQDGGRPGLGHLGVPVGGAADRWSFAIANVLAGNPPQAAAIEMTIAGPHLRATRDLTIALAGADLGARAEPGGRQLLPGRSIRVRPDDRIIVPGPPRSGGARAYLAVGGGIDVPVVLGSRSTCLPGGFGGIDGRPLQAGDRIPVAPDPGAAAGAAESWPGDAVAPRRLARDRTLLVRVLEGPDETLAGGIVDRAWTVAAQSDRMGLRLEGAAVTGASGPVTSHGVVHGTIQLPPDGGPIVLLADHQPTGGYGVAAVVIAADLPALGQLAPGDAARFEVVDLAAARAALEAQRAGWSQAVALLRGDAPWHDLWRSAGA